MQIEAGEYYRTRDGRKVVPMAHGEQWPAGPWLFKSDGEYYQRGGQCFANLNGSSGGGDIVAEWQDELADTDVVEMSIAELTAAFAEALKAVGRRSASPSLKVGDEVVLSAPARVAGFDKKNAMLVLSTGGSFAIPIAALEAA